MPTTIGKAFRFEAAHRLASLGPEHKCSRPHGHSYRVEIALTRAELVPPGFVTDFGDLAPFGRYLSEELDHRDLTETLPFEPTCELLARHLAQWFIANLEPDIPGRLRSVRVSETASTWAQYDVEERDGGRAPADRR
ncbi:6-carboxytetrahydropterin synthase [Streptomyces klenkii]|uniref:6-carboxy-5,6,7,8-tetrahydropterin synthase n=1 Tax=Streptomyces klenkii TaxID=1420899 RepID=A0A3B0A5R2_9ACTN|nr:6-carboxytetrahydropterin synthase [Streptomyces klenkii]RKN55076.1 6-carboxytetrahydropterin synthase [Streptomyces klenkii]